MSANTNNSQIFTSNTNENIIISNDQSYDDLIGYCALRKQFARIIPSYYTEIQKQSYKKKRQNTSNIEEYKKLKEEINIMKESIELLKETKQKKLKHIEELRDLMRKVGNKKLSSKEQKYINNTINKNYCGREISDSGNGFRCMERKGSNSIKGSIDEGLSMAPTTSGLSSGKDEDAGNEEGGNPQYRYSASSNSSSGSWCFIRENLPNKELLLGNNEKQVTTVLSK